MSALEYKVLINGSLPLDSHNIYHQNIKHRCTTTLLFCREKGKITREKTVLCDPGWTCAAEESRFILALAELSLIPQDLTFLFVTHRHLDHYCAYLHSPFLSGMEFLTEQNCRRFKDLEIISLEGHSRDSRALCFTRGNTRVAIAGDAVINEEYLLNWEVYRPNGYGPEEIFRTRESMKYLVDNFDIIIPGHGPPISINGKHRSIIEKKSPPEDF